MTVTEDADRSVSCLEGSFAIPEQAPPQLELKVYRDGCGVIRPETSDWTYSNLGWSISDRAGFEVLQRNAQGETRYRYSQPGTYQFVLVSFWDGAYRLVSNEVTIRC